MSHATARAKERLGFIPRPWQLLAVINAGQAKLVRLGENGRNTYDVPLDGRIIKVVVNKELDWVVTVLPDKSVTEVLKERRDAEAKRKRNFFRGVEENDDE
jgi:hypothetical protein